MSQPPSPPAEPARLKRQRLELTEAEERGIRVVMIAYDYRSLHQFARDVLLFLVAHPDRLAGLMPQLREWKQTKPMEDES